MATDSRVKLKSGTTIDDVYAAFQDSIQGDAPDDAIRGKRELQRVIHTTDLLYAQCDRLSVSSDWAYKFSEQPEVLVADEQASE